MASLPPAVPPETDASALRASHTKRTKALLGNVSALESEVKALRNAHKEHKRSSYISALQAHLHDRELVIDVLKQGWAEAMPGKSLADINEFVSRKTVGGPKRFRPKTREEMALEMQAQATEIESLRARLRQQDADDRDARKGDRASVKSAASVSQQIADALRPVREQVLGLEAAVEARQAQIRDLQLQIRSYAEVEAQAFKLAQQHLKTKDALTSLQNAHADLSATHAAVSVRLHRMHLSAGCHPHPTQTSEELEQTREHAVGIAAKLRESREAEAAHRHHLGILLTGGSLPATAAQQLQQQQQQHQQQQPRPSSEDGAAAPSEEPTRSVTFADDVGPQSVRALQSQLEASQEEARALQSQLEERDASIEDLRSQVRRGGGAGVVPCACACTYACTCTRLQLIALRQEQEEGGRPGGATPAPGGAPSPRDGGGSLPQLSLDVEEGGAEPHVRPAVVSTPHRMPKGASFGASPRGIHRQGSFSEGGEAGGGGGTPELQQLRQRVSELMEELKAEQLRFERTRAAMEDERTRWQASRGGVEKDARACSSVFLLLPRVRPLRYPCARFVQEDMDSAVDACAAAEQRATAAEAALQSSGGGGSGNAAAAPPHGDAAAAHARAAESAELAKAQDEALVAQVRSTMGG